jgi:hypothetical protein
MLLGSAADARKQCPRGDPENGGCPLSSRFSRGRRRAVKAPSLAAVSGPSVSLLVAATAASVSEDLVAARKAARESLVWIVNDLQVRHQVGAAVKLLVAMLALQPPHLCACPDETPRE